MEAKKPWKDSPNPLAKANLRMLNQLRWQLTGQLLRDAAVVASMRKRYVFADQDLAEAIFTQAKDMLEANAKAINTRYAEQRAEILAARKETKQP